MRLTRAVVEEAAAGGNAVILGRGGAFILGRKPGVLNVQLRRLARRPRPLPADAASRTRPTRRQLDEAALRELCKSIDSARAPSTSAAIFSADWMDARNYDLVVDTGRLGVARTVELIETAVRTDGTRT